MPQSPTNHQKTKRKPIDWSKYGAGSNRNGEDGFTWRSADVGDLIIGVLKAEPKEANTKFGPRLVFELHDVGACVASGVEESVEGPATVWPTAGLVDALGEAQVAAGDRIRIELVELIDTGKGNPFKSYEVVVDPEESF